MKKMPSSDGPSVAMPYNYNLCIHLTSKEIEALGMKELPEAGEEMIMQAKVKVVEVSEEMQGEMKQQRVKLAICDMGLDSKMSMEETAESIYPEGDAD